MSRQSTSRDIQRVTFVESLHRSLKKQASKAIVEQKKFISLANSYIEDGLEENECIELLMIDGLSREAAESYTAMSLNKEAEKDNLNEYSFQFEDEYGRIISSYDIGHIVRASNDSDAWIKTEELLDSKSNLEYQKILSVNRID